MNEEEIGRSLASQFAGIEPSSGFAASVMEAVLAEALAPPPIAFPWRRAIPGLAGAAVALAWGVAEFLRLSFSPGISPVAGAISADLMTAAGLLASIFAGSLIAAASAALAIKVVSTRTA